MARLRLPFALLAVVGIATASMAEPLPLDWQQYHGEISVPLLGSMHSIGTGTGVAQINPGLGLERLVLHGGPTISTLIPVTDPSVTAGGLASVGASVAFGSGTLGFGTSSGSPAVSSSALPLPGVLRLCFLAPSPCGAGSLSLPLTQSSGLEGVGVGGTAVLQPGSGTLRMSVVGAPWTIQTASTVAQTSGGGSHTLLAFGSAHGPASFTGSTALPGGSIQLVTPVRIESLGTPPSVGFAALRIELVPEPRLPVLLGAAASLLFLGAWRRHARRGR